MAEKRVFGRNVILVSCAIGILLFTGCNQLVDPLVGTWKERTYGLGYLTLNADGSASWGSNAGTVSGRWSKIDETHIRLSVSMAGMPAEYPIVYDPDKASLNLMGLEYYKAGAASGSASPTRKTTTNRSDRRTATTISSGSSIPPKAADRTNVQTTSRTLDANNQGSKDPVLYLDFDEGAGSVVADSSGYTNNGIIRRASWVAGKFGYALQFNGVDSYVQIPDSASLELTNDLTIELWTMPRATQTEYADILSKHANHPGGYNFEQKKLETNKYTLAWSNGVDWTCGQYTDPLVLNPGTWQHVAVSKSGSAVTYYRNGQEVARCSGTFPSISTNSLDLTIGRWSTGGRYYNGVIDEVRIYNRALTGEEINTQYQSDAARYL